MLYVVHQMFILRTLNVINVKAMRVNVNTGKTAITVYDEENYDNANKDEIIPLITTVKGDFKNHVLEILANSANMGVSTKELYKFIINEYPGGGANIGIKDLVDRASIANNKNPVTYRRCIDSLVFKGVLRRDSRNYTVNVKPEYDVSFINDIARYVVIKIKK